MCGIAGVLGLTVEPSVVSRMLQTMDKRGPDGSGVYQREDCTLLHTRLAVIDPQSGQQPMVLDWAGERYVLVYNGELYNTPELSRELKGLGHSFLGHSDTEVVLHSFAQWGEDCLERFNGIYAFAVWLEKEGRLFLARDRIGVKPLFYQQREKGLLFASEMKTILAHPQVRARLDPEGAAQLVLLGPGRMPGSGVLRNMMELEPGCSGWFYDGRLRITRYWRLRDREHRDTLEETVERVRCLVLDAIRRQLVADVPVGAFLSGGLDSSIISMVCGRELAKNGRQLRTYSVDYENNNRYFQPNSFQPDSDEAYIRLMQEYVGSCHKRTVLTPEDLFNALEAATLARDLPGMADVDFSLLVFCRDIRKEVKVALSGECADEIFGGYPWYRDPAVRSASGFPWAQNTRQRAGLLNGGILAEPEAYVMDACRKTCRESDILPDTPPLERRMKEMMNLNFRWFMQTLLDRKDRMSMYSSLEVRVPFCDHRIAEYLYGVPWEFKDLQGREKGLLRKAVEGLLPERVLHRKKSPYPKTFDPRYGEMMENAILGILEDKGSPLFHIVNQQRLSDYLGEAQSWPWYGQLMGRPQTIAYFLQMDYWLKQYQVEFLF